jgi:hypothetical protein
MEWHVNTTLVLLPAGTIYYGTNKHSSLVYVQKTCIYSNTNDQELQGIPSPIEPPEGMPVPSPGIEVSGIHRLSVVDCPLLKKLP